MTEGQAARQPLLFDRAFLTDAEEVTQLILVRHGEQHIPNPRSGPVGESFDPELSERGRRQAELVGARLSTEKIDAIYASPLKRAFDTGAEIARHHRLTPVVMDDLREVEIFRDVPADKSIGEYLGQGLLIAFRERMIRERKWDVYPYSESSFEFRKRTVNAIEAIIGLNPGKRVVIACHGGVINAYLGHIIGSPYDMFFRPAHTSISIAAAAPNEGIRAVHLLNDIHHLTTAEGSFVSH
ncbi:MAG: histidine phosphatase family protein [Dehalococcoidia bacterium]|nr:histidine phosphatase family protein [Dehalococcoidia bacterium]